MNQEPEPFGPPCPLYLRVDPAQVRQAQELKHASPLIAGRFDPSGKYLFVSAQDNTIQRWEPATSQKIPLAGHKSWVRGLAFTPDGQLLLSADYTGIVHVWEVAAEKPAPLLTIEAHQGWCRELAVSPDGKTLASCGNDHLVKLWSLADGKLIRELAGHDCHVYHVAFHPGGQFLVSADLKGVVKQWDWRAENAKAPIRELDAKMLTKYDPTFRADHGGIRGMAFTPDGGLLACAGITNVSNAFAGIGNPAVALFDWATGQRKHLLVAKEAFQGTCWGVACHPAGFLVGAAGGNGGVLLFWKPELDKGKGENLPAFFTFKLPNNARDLSLHPEGQKLAVPFADGVARIYDLAKK